MGHTLVIYASMEALLGLWLWVCFDEAPFVACHLPDTAFTHMHIIRWGWQACS